MKHRCPCVGEILTLVTKVHDSPTSLNMGIPILLCQEHGKPPTFFQKNPNGRRASGKERHWLSNEYRYKHASIYIYTHKVALKFEKAQIQLLSLTGGWKSNHLYSNTSPLCDFLPFNASTMYPVLLFKILSN